VNATTFITWNVVASGALFDMPDIRPMHHLQTGSSIGLITDSHGQVAQLSQAINYLKEKECGEIIHLGDICDSVKTHTADECISMIQKHNVIAVRGNNDHALSYNCNPGINKTTLDFIQSLPLVIQSQELFFAHSLPFVNKLGLSCMIQGLNSHFLKLCFDSLSENAILFRGHSHEPELIFQSNKAYQRMTIDLPAKTDLQCCRPCVITCGTVMTGQCMIYDPGDHVLLGCLINSF